MNLHHPKQLFLCALAGVGLIACEHVKVSHVPPGSSLRVAMAPRAELFKLPPSATPQVAVARSSNPSHESAPQPEKAERVADAYSRGEFCAKAGKDDEAIAAFREAVKIDPTFVDAWTYLAAIYEKRGNDKEAMEAFKHAKLASNKAG